MARSWRKLGMAAVVVLAAVGGVAYLFTATPVAVDSAEVSSGPLEVTVDDEAVTRIREVYIVSAPVTGQVQRTPLEEGDPVTANKTVVATIEPSAPGFLDERAQRVAASRVRAAEAALTYALASVKKVEAELKFAREDLERAERLVRSKHISERRRDEVALRVDTQAAALANANAEVEVKRQELDTARAQLIQPAAVASAKRGQCCVQVMSPIDGRILKVLVESKQVVRAGTGLLEIGDPSDLEIIVDLLSTDAVKVKPGDRAYVERWGGDKTLIAKVTRVEPAGFEDISALGIEEQRVNVRLDLEGEAEDRDRLGHDFRVFLRIVIWDADDALRVPISALFRKGTDWAVFVSAGDVAELRTLKLGKRNDKYAQVLGGLKVGERVVLHPSDRVTDGVALVERSTLD